VNALKLLFLRSLSFFFSWISALGSMFLLFFGKYVSSYLGFPGLLHFRLYAFRRTSFMLLCT
jgi:hypothetical protein